MRRCRLTAKKRNSQTINRTHPGMSAMFSQIIVLIQAVVSFLTRYSVCFSFSEVLLFLSGSVPVYG